MRHGLLSLLLSLSGTLLWPGTAQAACESGLAERMRARLYPERTMDAALAACKPWTAYTGRSLVVLPLVTDHSALQGQRVFDLALLLIQRPDNGNTERDEVIAQSYQAGALHERGPTLQELRLDTSRYVLRANQRAFGLRARYRGTEPATPFSSETLQLFLPLGGQLQAVLHEVEMERDNGRWDLQCAGHYEQLRTRLSLEPATQAQGWATLVLSRTTGTRRTLSQPSGACIEKAAPEQHHLVRLQHNGTHYALPSKLLKSSAR